MPFQNPLILAAIEAAIEAGKVILEIYEQQDFQVRLKTDTSPLTIADQRAHEIILSCLTKTGFPVLSEEGKTIPYLERKEWDYFWLVDPLDGTKEFINRNGEFTVNIALVHQGKPITGVVYVPVLDTMYIGDEIICAWKIKQASVVFNNQLGESWKEHATPLPEKKARVYYTIVASRSHLTPETTEFINRLKNTHPDIELVSRGSSLKLCMVAEGTADVYPRFAPTSEWDTAAGHAIALASGAMVVQAMDESKELIYNKENLQNPWFIAKRYHSY